MSITLPDERFDMYPSKPPEGTWAYVVDDYGIVFGRGWWPFYDNRSLQPSAVRLAPDTAFRAWRNEYVLVYPGIDDDRTCWFQVSIYLRPQGMGAYVWDSPTIYLDIPTGTWVCHGNIPDEVASDVDTKVFCVFQLIHQMRGLRRKKVAAPPLAHEAWIQDEDGVLTRRN